ncbi:TerB N-terminal domain-containing protein [Phycicoccus sp. M110.8]|uniref:tellurite resistance TerB family protein n=1 Tax=Phycicoccus sp. M110.8 TaxID=3075433 RepID=UPI0028FD35C9|nr:TerB N-terminal domain-containing protein [Phycicoccus sp. M110.8]MDU0314103.1 TerB N-terminal domain-containing protein [Phycicoccus sp. M110.8]
MVTVAGYNLPGMVYVGRGLASPKANPDPSLIDPNLRVDTRRPDRDGKSLGYWPSYSNLTPGARAAYLHWLSTGASNPTAPIGYVFLYFYGLERRALIDIAANKSLAPEVVSIRAEVTRLLNMYGNNGSFSSYASQFLPVLDLLEATAGDPVNAPVPPLVRQTWPIPMTLRVALGDLVADGLPIPARWALAWAWYHPEIYPRTAAYRCPEEFAALFTLRYEQKHKAGIKVRSTSRPVKVSYYTASAGIGAAELEMTAIPDVFESAGPGRQLRDLFEAVTDELDPYSRWVGRNPNPTPKQSLAGAALLPAGLVASDSAVSDFRGFVESSLDGKEQTVIDGTELLRRWPVANPDKFAKAETTALAAMLGQFGVGVEPDVRLGGPPITAGPVVLFRTGPATPAAATPMYAAATTLLHLAAVVSAADGTVSPEEQNHLVEHLNAALHLTDGERTRLRAHLTWLLNSDLKTTGLKKRLDALSVAQREGIGQLLVTVAAADGVISPAEVTSLTKIYTLLGLDPASVTSRLHISMTEPSRPATGPVRVREAGPDDAGFAVPARGRHRAPEPAASGVVLDEDVLAAKLEQTAEVSALLRTLFTEDDDTTPHTTPAPAPQEDAQAATATSAEPAAPAGEVIAGLDAPTSALLRELSGRSTWTRAEFDDLAAKHSVMPDGAIDMLNEAAIDACGEPVLEGDDDLDINSEGLEGLLAS